MPVATNTKMLYSAYYFYDSIVNKDMVSNEFVNVVERGAFENVKNHVINNCNQMDNISSERMVELGRIVFEKICSRLRKDIDMYSQGL